ncbi:MAG: creatininase family protein [Bacillota bacterium]
MSERKVMLHELTRSAFQAWLAQDTPVVIIAVGSIEQHGPHLPLGTDSLGAVAVASKVAAASGALVVHPCWPGYSPHHMGFPGTVTFKFDTLRAVLMDTIESLVHHGVNKILLMNFHGGNREVVASVERLARRQFGAQVVNAVMPTGSRTPEETNRQQELMDVHSGAGETGFALAEFGHLVEMERVHNWKPSMKLPAELKKLADEGVDRSILANLVFLYLNNSHEFTADGIWGYADPNDADPERAAKQVEEMVQRAAEFIAAWKRLP